MFEIGYTLPSEEQGPNDLARFARSAEETGFRLALTFFPDHFEAVAKLVTQEPVAKSVICGPNPDRHVEGIHRYVDAGVRDRGCVQRVGPDQAGFFHFSEGEEGALHPDGPCAISRRPGCCNHFR